MTKLREEVERVEQLPKARGKKWLAESRKLLTDTPKPHPPRNRGEGTGVDGLMPVGQEDAPSE